MHCCSLCSLSKHTENIQRRIFKIDLVVQQQFTDCIKNKFYLKAVLSDYFLNVAVDEGFNEVPSISGFVLFTSAGSFILTTQTPHGSLNAYFDFLESWLH